MKGRLGMLNSSTYDTGTEIDTLKSLSEPRFQSPLQGLGVCYKFAFVACLSLE